MNGVHEGKDEREDRPRAGDERRHALVLAAYQLIAEKGFEHLRTREVAARVGINIATLHYYFPSKEDLIRGVVEYLLQVFKTVPAPLSELDLTTPWDHIREMFLETRYRLQETPEMLIVLGELGLRSLRDSSIRPALKHLDDEWHGYLKRIVMDGIQKGTFRVDLDPESTATELMLLLKGIVYHSITSSRTIDFDRVLKDVERLLLY